MSTNTTYALISSGTWQVPAGVSSITVECFGSTKGYSSADFSSSLQAARSGASYSKSTNIAVTEGQIFYSNIATDGAVTWFNAVNSQPVVGVDTPTTSCLAVGGETTSTSQVAANIGDVKYAGGAGFATTGDVLSGTGGSAGPNGAGAAAAGQYSNTPLNGYRVGTGGGGNGGSQGGLGVIPYGRTGSGVTPGAGNGGYWTGSNLIYQTIDQTGQSSYSGNSPSSTVNIGAYGGAVAYRDQTVGPCGYDYTFRLDGNNGVILITLNNPTQLSIVFQGTAAISNFVVPSNFVSLISIEAIGTGGSSAGGGISGGSSGGAYSKTNGSSITTPIVAGSTNVYYLVDSTGSWLRIGGTLTAPTSTTDGVLAKAGSTATNSVGATGGQASLGVGDVKFSGGDGGQGYVGGSNYARGGAGGAAGPNSAGGNGGSAYLLAQNNGGGGGGATNNTEAGQAGTSVAGGQGANGLGTGGAGGTPASTNGKAGTNGGGSGGPWSSSGISAGTPLIINGIYGIKNSSGSGGGTGTVAFTYSLVSGGANTSNFFQFF